MQAEFKWNSPGLIPLTGLADLGNPDYLPVLRCFTENGHQSDYTGARLEVSVGYGEPQQDASPQVASMRILYERWGHELPSQILVGEHTLIGEQTTSKDTAHLSQFGLETQRLTRVDFPRPSNSQLDFSSLNVEWRGSHIMGVTLKGLGSHTQEPNDGQGVQFREFDCRLISPHFLKEPLGSL